jgi:hypothetical protein
VQSPSDASVVTAITITVSLLILILIVPIYFEMILDSYYLGNEFLPIRRDIASQAYLLPDIRSYFCEEVIPSLPFIANS